MACFTPKNNTYCSPNVNAFLDTRFEKEAKGNSEMVY